MKTSWFMSVNGALLYSVGVLKLIAHTGLVSALQTLPLAQGEPGLLYLIVGILCWRARKEAAK